MTQQTERDALIARLRSSIGDLEDEHSFEYAMHKAADAMDAQALRIAELETLSITNIMIGAVPGFDGGVEEVYAKSVAEVVDLLTSLAAHGEDLQTERDTLRAELDALRGQAANAKCWCETCRPVTFADMRMVLCPECGNKRCPKANDHRNACTGSNELGQKGSSWEHVINPQSAPVAPAQPDDSDINQVHAGNAQVSYPTINFAQPAQDVNAELVNALKMWMALAKADSGEELRKCESALSQAAQQKATS